jgi:hypothetical protein
MFVIFLKKLFASSLFNTSHYEDLASDGGMFVLAA